MSTVKYGFIGCGNMGSALVRAVCKAQDKENIIVSDKASNKAEMLANELGCSYANIDVVAKTSKFIFLGVKPQVMPELLRDIAPILAARNDRFILVTMAAGIKIASLISSVGANYPVIRIMPNTPVSVSKGMILYTPSKDVFMDEISEFCNALEFAGLVDKIDEKFIDAASALSGCGPAFVYMFAESLADAGVKCGLTREKALVYASQTLSGAAELLLKSGKHPAVLKDEVCSPSGSTIEGVNSLENSAFRAAVMNAVKASFDRTKELGK